MPHVMVSVTMAIVLSRVGNTAIRKNRNLKTFYSVKDKCVDKLLTYQCNNELRHISEPCHTKKGTLCPDPRDRVLNNGTCVWYQDVEPMWKCGDNFIKKTEPCDHKGRLTCPEDHCYNVETRGCNRTKDYEEGGGQNCGGICLNISQPCDGECRGGLIKYNQTCFPLDQIWQCGSHYQPLSQPCTHSASKAVCPLTFCLGNSKISPSGCSHYIM